MLPNPSLLELDSAAELLRDVDGNVRAALICWGIAISAFVVLRIRREALIRCLIVAGAVVGLAAALVDVLPAPAIAGSSGEKIFAPRPSAAAPLRGPLMRAPMYERQD